MFWLKKWISKANPILCMILEMYVWTSVPSNAFFYSVNSKKMQQHRLSVESMDLRQEDISSQYSETYTVKPKTGSFSELNYCPLVWRKMFFRENTWHALSMNQSIIWLIDVFHSLKKWQYTRLSWSGTNVHLLIFNVNVPYGLLNFPETTAVLINC